MQNYVLVMKEAYTCKVVEAHYIEASTEVDALNRISQTQLRNNDWDLFETTRSSSKWEMVTDGRIDEVLPAE
jgi:hypothetical protein